MVGGAAGVMLKTAIHGAENVALLTRNVRSLLRPRLHRRLFEGTFEIFASSMCPGLRSRGDSVVHPSAAVNSERPKIIELWGER